MVDDDGETEFAFGASSSSSSSSMRVDGDEPKKSGGNLGNLKKACYIVAMKRYQKNLTETYPGHCSRCGWGCSKNDRHPCRYNESGIYVEKHEKRDIPGLHCDNYIWRNGPSSFVPLPPPQAPNDVVICLLYTSPSPRDS